MGSRAFERRTNACARPFLAGSRERASIRLPRRGDRRAPFCMRRTRRTAGLMCHQARWSSCLVIVFAYDDVSADGVPVIGYHNDKKKRRSRPEDRQNLYALHSTIFVRWGAGSISAYKAARCNGRLFRLWHRVCRWGIRMDKREDGLSCSAWIERGVGSIASDGE